MTGGIFTAQNKVRPGAYIKFKAVQQPANNVGTRGIVAVPCMIPWLHDGTVVELLSTDLADGTCLAKTGCYGSEDEMQIVREALKNAYKAYVYKLNTGGTKASVLAGELNIFARYPGENGNKISLIIKQASGKYQVQTLFDGQTKDLQTVSDTSELVNNDWIEFGEGSLSETAGITLTGGTNGEVTQESYTGFLAAIKAKTWNTVACPSMRLSGKSSNFNEIVVNYIKGLRDAGMKRQAVINGYPDANHEGIISVDQGYITPTETVTMDSFVGYVAGLTAGANVNQSNTYAVIPNAIEIINPKTDEEIEAGLSKGQFLLSYRSDEAIVVEKDINTLHEYAADKGPIMSKNRVLRVLDDINNSIKQTFEIMFIGKINNDDSGRALFKSTILSYMDELNKMGAIDTVEADDVVVSVGNDIDSIVVNLSVKPVDAMEKLYMTVTVG